jgi:poly-beta-1,6-N-acetyl-D-glucosamine synthase
VADRPDLSSPFVLVTPARDEEANIARTVESVLAQSMRPSRWVIVDDGSVDRTAECARRAAAGEQIVTVLSRPRGRPVDFASKVHAFSAGVAELAATGYDFIGNLDADISLPRDYYEQLLSRFATRPRLGLAGGAVVVEVEGRIRGRRASATSVAGAVQFFRRQCFDDVDGLMPLRLGGEDSAAEILARMNGWEVETFSDLSATHHGPVHNRKRSASAAWFSRGRVNHSLGYDPLFQVAMSAYRVADRPYGVGGAFMLAGYITAAAQRRQRSLPSEAVTYLRREQRQRLRRLLSRR